MWFFECQINKEDSIYELVTDNDLDVLALTERWYTDNSDVSLGLLTPPGYAIVQTHRSSQDGGVHVTYHDSLCAWLNKCEKYSSFEHQTENILSDFDVLQIITLYNPSGNFTAVLHAQFNDLLCLKLKLENILKREISISTWTTSLTPEQMHSRPNSISIIYHSM